MNDLEQRVKTLETKVKVLEETLETLKNMSLSEQMGSFIQSRQKSLRMVELLNSVSDDDKLDFDKERATLDNVREAKRNVDEQLSRAIKNASSFSEDYPDDPRYFNYEIETGKEETRNGRPNAISALTHYVGKGIRITSYNGFETERVIVPKEIDGYTVVSIGEKAFMNASISQIILPSTLKGIMLSAFEGCQNLTNIDLPDGLEYLGSSCFQNTALAAIAIPDSVISLGCYCFKDCKNLEKVSLGKRVTTIDYCAFEGCSKLTNLSLPESLQRIKFQVFTGTNIRKIIFPENLKNVSSEIFKQNSYSYGRSTSQITCVFLGKETIIEGGLSSINTAFHGVGLIYCLPGSQVQKYAREHQIPIKPLSEFRMEDYQ